MRWLTLLLGFVLICFKGYNQPVAPPFEVIAYYSGNGDHIEEYSIGKLTQLIFSFLHLKDDTLYFSSPLKKEALKKVVALKSKYPKLKVLVSLGGWGGCKTCSDVFSYAESRRNFAGSVAKLMKEYQVDGIDLDWEYPAIEGYPGHPFQVADKENFTDLILKIRQAIGISGELSFAAGGFTDFLQKSVDWKAIMPHLNRVNLMTYDLISGYSTQTGHHTALMSRLEQKESIDNCVKWLLDFGVPPEKLVIGAAFYARIWENVPNTNWGLYQPGKFKQSLDFKNFDRLKPDSGWAHQWDAKALAPYAYHSAKRLFATYDNSNSIFEKVQFARIYGLGGIMFWELLCDVPGKGLLDAMYDAVEKTKNK